MTETQMVKFLIHYEHRDLSMPKDRQFELGLHHLQPNES